MKKFYILLLFIVAQFLSCDTTEPPEALTYHNKILFTSSRSGKEQLYMMNPDGSNITQITSGEFSHSNGRWSPNADKIVCNTDEMSSTAGMPMELINPDGTGKKLLNYGNQMSWYPDGSLIFYTFCPSCELGILNLKLYSMTSKGENERVESEKWAAEVDFSPDGEKMAFAYVATSDSVPTSVIKILDYPSFSNERTVGPKGAIEERWSPTGIEFLFLMNIKVTEASNNIFVMKNDGTDVRQITDNVKIDIYHSPRWSPDGKKIIFLAYTPEAQKWCLYMINKDGTDLHKVIDDATITSCDWSK